MRKAVAELHVAYPVALDNDYKIWKAFSNSFWPADYLIDATGRVRHHHFGEGKYAETEETIQSLLKERNGQLPVNGLVQVSATGTEAAPDSDVESPETYIGYDRGDNFLSPGGFTKDAPHTYAAPAHLEQNQWDFPALGRTLRRWRLWTRSPEKLSFGSTRAMCTWCWGLPPTVGLSASG